jgi:HupE / UreJ protein
MTGRTRHAIRFSVLAAVGLLAPAARAHDIPSDVTVQAFLKPEGRTLHLLVRVPIGAMRDIEFPVRGPGYLDIAAAGGALRDASTLWISDAIELYEGNRKLPRPSVVTARVSLPSDRSFASYEEALGHIEGPALPQATELIWDQGLLDVAFDYPIESDRAEISIHPGLARLGIRVVTVLRFLPPGGAVRAFEFQGDPGLVRLDPRWHQAALRFVEMGFFHILDGIDHLLFLFCLVIPYRKLRPLVLVVTSFTVAHSVTLIASAYDMAPDALWFPPLVETLIAMSIVYMALENIVGGKVHKRWMITFAFGLVHGFGFSFALRQTLQFAGTHLLTSLLSFNVGVELGQLLVLVLLVPALTLFFRYVVAERMGTILLSAIVAHTGWHWMTERAAILREFSWSAVDAASIASLIRWLMVFVAAVGLVWLVGILRRRPEPEIGREAATGTANATRTPTPAEE